jgi:glyoxylase-like metal-dependent hydrolase (beta-lactamase superfamily II)
MADVFTLEALDAKYGDSLLLHYGDADAPRLIVIDGGPASVYEDALRPRLNAIQTTHGGGQLEIRMLMVSHIDLDHINGVLKLTAALR